MSSTEFDVFKEISIGGLRKEHLLRQLFEAGIQFTPYADTLFDHFQFSPSSKAEKVNLVKVTLSDLGLEDTFTFEEFSSRASMLGLKLCPLYLAAFLRLEYLDQPEGPYLTVASHKPSEDENFPNGFAL